MPGHIIYLNPKLELKMYSIKRYLAFSLMILSLPCLAQEKEIKKEVSEERQFNEPFRPQYHFTPATNWMNDPNGMVYYEGEYHLFYQHHPHSNIWGPMHWGHAISTDMIHWEHQPIALFPDEHGTIFSGSAVADIHNTSGLGTKENPPLVAIFTYHDVKAKQEGKLDFQTQGIAYSTDKGRTWTKYESNPVLKNPGIKDFRDPKVSWFGDKEDNGKWIMTLAVKDKISFYSSPNLIDWQHESDFNPAWGAYGGVWECPDLFELPTADGGTKWVLLVSINPGAPNGGSGTQYFVGDFDGKNFNVEGDQVKWLDYGADNYAGVTWSNIPQSDGRRLFMGWMSNWTYANTVPTEVWRSATTLPRSLELITHEGDNLLASRPVKELGKLRVSSETMAGNDLTLSNELVEIELEISEENFEVILSNNQGNRIIIGKNETGIYLDRGQSGLTEFNEEFKTLHNAPDLGLQYKKLKLFIDRSSIEVFFNDGELVMSELVFPNSPYTRLETQGFGNTVKVHQLKSIW